MERKRPPNPHPPAEPREKGGSMGKGRSLREQVQAVSRLIVAAPERKAAAEVKRKATVPRDDLTFRQLAEGVAPLPQEDRPLPAAPVPASESALPRREPGERLWVEQAGGVVRARADGVPMRLLSELEGGRFVPRREIDLHRQSAAAARQTLDQEIREARREGIGCVLVICGRGSHSSPDGPVLPDVAIQRLSEELARDVLAFATAPRKWGGPGALIVRLRDPATS